MDVLLEFLFELFGEIIIALFSGIIDNLAYKITSDRRRVKITKIILGILFFAVALSILIYSLILKNGIIVKISIAFVIWLVFNNLMKFINNNVFKKKWLNVSLITINDIVHYSYYIALLALSDYFDGVARILVIISAITCIIITLAIDSYRISKLGIKYRNDKAEKEIDETKGGINEENNEHIIFERTDIHKKRIWLKYTIMALIISFLFAIILLGLLIPNVEPVDGDPRYKAIITLCLSMFVIYVVINIYFFAGIYNTIKYEQESIEIIDNVIYYRKTRGLHTVCYLYMKKKDIVYKKGNGIYSISGLNRIKIKILECNNEKKTIHNKTMSICHGITKKEKELILNKLSIYDEQ